MQAREEGPGECLGHPVQQRQPPRTQQPSRARTLSHCGRVCSLRQQMRTGPGAENRLQELHPGNSHLTCNGTLKFADPITYILSNYAKVIPCDTITPAHWFLDGKWCCATPHSTTCKPPTRLKVASHHFVDEGLTRGIGGSIYSAKQLESH